MNSGRGLKLDLELRIKNNVLVVDKIHYNDSEEVSKDKIDTYEDIVIMFKGITFTGSSLLELFSGVAGETLTVKGTLSSTMGVEEVELNYTQIDDLYEIDGEEKLWVH